MTCMTPYHSSTFFPLSNIYSVRWSQTYIQALKRLETKCEKKQHFIFLPKKKKKKKINHTHTSNSLRKEESGYDLCLLSSVASPSQWLLNPEVFHQSPKSLGGPILEWGVTTLGRALRTTEGNIAILSSSFSPWLGKHLRGRSKPTPIEQKK